MKFTWRLHKKIDVPTVRWHESSTISGARFSIRQISLGSRIELMKAMRVLVEKNDFLRAGDLLDQTDSMISDLMARSLYLRWGLCDIEGLTLDGKQVNVDSLIDRGPEVFCNEIVARIRESLELSETERKNY